MTIDTLASGTVWNMPSGVENIILETVRAMANEWYNRPCIINEIFSVQPLDEAKVEYPLDFLRKENE